MNICFCFMTDEMCVIVLRILLRKIINLISHLGTFTDHT